ncbi:MAG: aminotransferase class IV [Gammaproteobacteria bacterium]|nr:aminotransferase class IV [Gammaproteobacteria bacterium]
MKPTGYIDGVIAPLDETRVPVLDRGFLYGDSIYEVFRTYSGIPFMFEEHHARLMNSAKLSMLTVRQNKQDIIDAITATIAAAEVAPGEDVYVRYQITRGQGAIDLHPDPELQSRLIIIVKPAPQWNRDFYRIGMALAIPQQRRNAVDALNPNIKGGNYLNNILGLTQARALGADDCLMLDADGRVTECSNSNAWFVLGGKPVTPATGNLLGITRKKLVDLLGAAGYAGDAIERELHCDELARATECFVTSATREVMPVARLRLPDGAMLEFPHGGGEVTRLAIKRYADMLADFVANNRGNAWF